MESLPRATKELYYTARKGARDRGIVQASPSKSKQVQASIDKKSGLFGGGGRCWAHTSLLERLFSVHHTRLYTVTSLAGVRLTQNVTIVVWQHILDSDYVMVFEGSICTLGETRAIDAGSGSSMDSGAKNHRITPNSTRSDHRHRNCFWI